MATLAHAANSILFWQNKAIIAQRHTNILPKSETLIAFCAFWLRDLLSAIKNTETSPIDKGQFWRASNAFTFADIFIAPRPIFAAGIIEDEVGGRASNAVGRI